MPIYAWMISNTVAAGCLALLVAGVCRWRRFGPAVTHALWLVVLVKLVTPPVLDLPLPWPSLPRFSSAGPVDVASDGREDSAFVFGAPAEETASFGPIA